jgi:hypothetical protein
MGKLMGLINNLFSLLHLDRTMIDLKCELIKNSTKLTYPSSLLGRAIIQVMNYK